MYNYFNNKYQKNIFFNFTIIILLSLISLSQCTKKIMLLEGDQLDYQIKNASKTNTTLFLIFYVNHCLYCSHALKVLKDNIIKNFKEEDKISFGIINLENQTNIWTGLRFNITRIPYIILVQNNKMYYYQNSFEENSVMKFITEEKNIEDALDIPPPVNFFGKLKAVMKELNEKIVTFFGQFGMEERFASKITYLIVVIGFISLIYIENQLIKFCKLIFSKKKQTKNKNKKDDKTKKD